jgi:hypothetical protein
VKCLKRKLTSDSPLVTPVQLGVQASAYLVSKRLDELKAAIEAEPKSTKRKMRLRIGPKKKWFNEVETVVR